MPRCIKSRLYTTFLHMSAGCTTISSLCVVVVISKESLEGSGAAFMLFLSMAQQLTNLFTVPLEVQTSQLQPSRPDRHFCPTSAGYGVWVPAAFQGQGVSYWGVRGRCSCSVWGHMHSQPSGMPQASNLPTAPLAACTTAWENLWTTVSPPTFWLSKANCSTWSSHSSSWNMNVLQLVSRLFFNEKWL